MLLVHYCSQHVLALYCYPLPFPTRARLIRLPPISIPHRILAERLNGYMPRVTSAAPDPVQLRGRDVTSLALSVQASVAELGARYECMQAQLRFALDTPEHLSFRSLDTISMEVGGEAGKRAGFPPPYNVANRRIGRGFSGVRGLQKRGRSLSKLLGLRDGSK